MPDYAGCNACDAFFTNAGTFTITYADDNTDNYANEGNHAGGSDDICTVLCSRDVEFGAGNVSF